MARRAGQVPFSLSEPATVDLPSRATFQLPIVHASWSPDGHNLAVLDSRGGLVIYQCVVALNRLNPRGLFHYDDDQATGAAVGLEWLKGFRPVCSSLTFPGRFIHCPRSCFVLSSNETLRLGGSKPQI